VREILNARQCNGPVKNLGLAESCCTLWAGMDRNAAVI
jgi:hypothetical protein